MQLILPFFLGNKSWQNEGAGRLVKGLNDMTLHRTNPVLLVTFLILFAPSIALAENISGRVVGITDGDTVTLLTSDNVQYKIRLAGIDAPEKNQPFGQKSKQALSDCAYDRLATIEGDKKDRYDRVVAKVIVGGVDCNLKQLKLGLAWHYKKYQSEQSASDRKTYGEAEKMAYELKQGLWIEANTIAPWDWRKSKKPINN